MFHKMIRIFIFCISVAIAVQVSAQKKDDGHIQVVGGSQGTEFWIAIPANDFPQQPVTSLDVQIASAYSTEVTVYDAAGDQTYRRNIEPYVVRILNDTRGETNWSWEVREIERVVKKGIRITAPQPISVYVLNGKDFTSDGFLAIPTSAFGKKYIVTSYYDFAEYYQWPAGFVIVAKENGTVVNIKLRGTGKGYAKTMGGKQIGDEWQVSMEEGDVYCVTGDGTTRGLFDITGTEITSNKPIGMLSYHNRTTMPNLLVNGNGRDHMVEMTPPVETWGKKYVTVEYARNGSNPKAKGDVFRVISSQPNTTWTLKYYDKKTKKLLGQGGGKLMSAGDFADLAQATAPSVLTNGYSVWEADKPIFVMQYACSASFDGDDFHDPFMINVVPQEQFIPNTIFQSPTDPKYMVHKLNLIVWADTADPNYVDNLKSLEIDGKAVWNHPRAAAPTLLYNHMGNNLHWTQIDFNSEATAHHITTNGKIKFGGYIYGFGNVDSYGWPAASGFRPTTSVDTLPPLLTSTDLCGDFTYEATELRNIPDPPLATPRDTDQVETGVFSIDTVFGSNSTNYRLVYITADPPLPKDNSYKRFSFKWEVIDKSKDAYCEFDVTDWAGNFTRDTIQYFAPKLSFEPPILDFGKLRLGTNKTLQLTIRNTTGGNIELRRSRVLAGTYFSITANGIPPAVTLKDGETVTLDVTYQGTRETTNLLSDLDIDTIEISTECAPFRLPLVGVAAIPRIEVDNFNAGIVGVNEKVCKQPGITIKNPGSDTLVVTALTGYNGQNFTVSSPTTPPLPIRVAPKQEVVVTEICYERGSVGTDSIDVVFENNGDGPDSVSTWTGRTQEPGPRITGYNWLKRRVNTLHQALIEVRNSGNQAITLTDVTFMDGSKYWPAGSNDANFVFKINGLMQNGTPVTNPKVSVADVIQVLVEFRPADRQTYSQAIRPVWQESGIPDVSALLEGEGILPEITTQGASLLCLETPQGQPVSRNLVITNNGNMDLTVSVALAPGSDAAWSFATPPANPYTVSHIAGNNTLSIPVQYTRPSGYNGGSNLVVEVTHDAIPGNGTDSVLTTTAQTTERFDVASCAGPDIRVTDIDYGRQLANCDQPLMEFTISNTGGGVNRLEIRDLQLVDADAGVFQIVNILDASNVPVTLPFMIPAQSTYRVVVRFIPNEPNTAPWPDRSFSARIKVVNYEEGQNTEFNPDVYVQLRGIGYVVPFAFKLSNNRQGSVTDPNTDPSARFTVSASSSNWAGSGILSLTADVIYVTNSMAFTPGSITKLDLPGDWTVSDPVRTDINGTQSRLRFSLNGFTPLSADGNLFSFGTTLLLSEEFKQNQDLEVNLFRPCFITTTSGCSTEITNCALTKRVVSLSKNKHFVKPPSPNPVSSDVAVVEFGIGVTAPTTIELVNTAGQVVATLIRQSLEDGEYSLSIPVQSLSNGVYSLRIQSSDYAEAVPFVIAR